MSWACAAEKVFYIIDERTSDTIIGYLRNEGVDVDSVLSSGQLSLFTRDDAYMRGGCFNPDAMIELLKSETARALEEGYSALRVTGEMTWALRGLPGSERLMEYEAKLNTFFPGSHALAVCQYDRRRFAPSVILDVLSTHPIAIVGTEVYDNFYYISPEDFLTDDVHSAELECRLRNLVERKKVETELRALHRDYQIVFESVPAMIRYKDTCNTFIRVNQAAAKASGRSVEELEGRSAYELFPDEAERYYNDDMEVIASGRPRYNIVEQMQTASGEKIWVETTKVPVPDEKGHISGIVAFSNDITERIQAGKEREKLISELKEALASIKTLRGLLPICMYCKKIRDDSGYWQKLERYISSHSDAEFSHGICQECEKKLEKQLDEEMLNFVHGGKKGV